MFERDLIESPLGLPTISTLDVGRLKQAEETKYHSATRPDQQQPQLPVVQKLKPPLPVRKIPPIRLRRKKCWMFKATRRDQISFSNQTRSVKSVVFNKKLSTQNSYIQLVHVFDQLIETRRQGLEKTYFRHFTRKVRKSLKNKKCYTLPRNELLCQLFWGSGSNEFYIK